MRKRFLKQGVSIAAAVCLAMSSPIGAMADMAHEYAVSKTDGKEEKHEGKIDAEDCGILADNGSAVEQKGDVKSKNEAVNASSKSTVDIDGNVEMTDGGDRVPAVSAFDGSNVRIEGNVKSNGIGVQAKKEAHVDVEGAVEAKSTGVSSANSDVTVKHGVKVSGTDEQESVYGVVAYDSDVSVAGGIEVAISGQKGRAEGKSGEASEFSATGVNIYQKDGENTSVHVTGNVTAFAKGSEASGARADGLQITDGTKLTVDGNVTATAESSNAKAQACGVAVGSGTVIVKGDVSAAAKSTAPEAARADGIVTNLELAGKDVSKAKDANTVIIVNGSVTSTGAGASLEGNLGKIDVFVGKDMSGEEGLRVGANFGTANCVVDGTLSGESAAIHTQDFGAQPGMEEGELNVTVWELKSGGDLVKAEEVSGYDPETDAFSWSEKREKAEEILKNVNYIIRTDEVENGVISLSGTTRVVGANGTTYDTAKEAQEVIIRVKTADGYQLDAVKNGDALLTKNADGSYTLVVPRGGGVELSAVLSAIKKNENEMNGGSDDSDDSGNPPAGYGEEKGNAVTSASGASVTRTVTEDGGIKTSLSKVEIGGKTAEVATRVTVENGQSRTLRTVSGDIAGVSFRGVGTVSADGSSVTLEDGRTFSVISAPSLMITENGVTRGYFLNADGTGPIATGKTEVYYCLGEDGQLHAHWVDPNGFFYTGTVVIDGKTYTFNEEGEVSNIA
ncbi:hypothetical protein [[Clostridium] aminophilum]|uniref:Uncharacterized protein n=1 Tax=[Clostridium] aminophilum TaxID=1526 RepID=A0A1I6JR36_9FIRM|nr:hypothetical protein [[Clostridium] aminophilum]SFR81381.1 hypothetical protein SAMN02910262_01812 [[Clostridium] aminophilum]